MSKSAKFDSVFKKLINKMQKYNIKKLSSVMDGEVVFSPASNQKHKSRKVSVGSQHSLSVGTKLGNKRRRGFLTLELYSIFQHLQLYQKKNKVDYA